MLLKKVKAGALQLTLYIAVIVTLLLLTFTLVISYHKKNQIKSSFVLESIKNTDKGIINSFKLNTSHIDTLVLNLNDENYKSLKIHTSTWGLYQKTIAISSIKSIISKKVALIGYRQNLNNRVALKVNDNNKPILLVGNTKIVGNTYTPKRGIKPGYISGESFYGNQLVQGKINISINKIPQLSKDILYKLKKLRLEIPNVEVDRFIDIYENNTFVNSFLKPFQVLYSNEKINLENKSLTGHIYIYSKEKITINKSVQLKDVVLIAPIIEIKKGVKGTFQAIATKNIIVEENCKLNYPSTLSVVEYTPNNNETPPIIINNNSVINGSVLYYGLKKKTNYNAQLYISENAIINGEVICNQNLELKGKVIGSVYSNNFITKAYGSIYQNHIFNAEINVLNLHPNYVGLHLNKTSNSVAKWLY